MNTGRRRFYVLLVLLLVPVIRYILDFLVGYSALDEGYAVLSSLFGVLGVPLIAGVAASRLWGPLPGRSNLVVWLVVAMGVVLAFFCVPPGAICYSHGFQAALRTRVNLSQLQEWTTGAISKYEKNELALASDAPHLPATWKKVGDSELPSFLKTGVFEKKRSYPVVVVCAPENERPFIYVTWYLHGLLVGPADFRRKPSHWYESELKPGIYVFQGMK